MIVSGLGSYTPKTAHDHEVPEGRHQSPGRDRTGTVAP
jgi:hypothetical protein